MNRQGISDFRYMYSAKDRQPREQPLEQGKKQQTQPTHGTRPESSLCLIGVRGVFSPLCHAFSPLAIHPPQCRKYSVWYSLEEALLHHYCPSKVLSGWPNIQQLLAAKRYAILKPRSSQDIYLLSRTKRRFWNQVYKEIW